jgi:beta-1,4-mannosyltransferase
LPPLPRPLTATQEKHELLLKLQPELARGLHPHDWVAQLYAGGELAPGHTLCTQRGGGAVRERRGRPAIVVSSTSWTPDEDFGLLLKAAEVTGKTGKL